jgi:hypothetical protein
MMQNGQSGKGCNAVHCVVIPEAEVTVVLNKRGLYMASVNDIKVN